MISLETPLSAISGIGPRFIQRLKQLHIQTVRDLLWHFPARYEDFSKIYSIADLEPGQQATIQGTIEEIDSRRSWTKRMTIVEAVIADESGTIRVVWFNQPYIKTILKPGKLANFSGKVSTQEGELFLSHPTYELVGKNETKHTARLVPIYPETKGLTSKGLRFLIQPLLKNLRFIPEWIPREILETENLMEISDALSSVHFPKRYEDASEAKKRFAFEDLFLLQLANLKQKMAMAQEHAIQIPGDTEWIKEILTKLPFELTLSQKKSLWEIIQDIQEPKPMNRLLQGDVGSGKTVVVALTSLLVKKAGHQTALMAPTEVLARQHFETFKKLFKAIPQKDQPSLGLLTSSGGKIFYESDLEEEAKKDKVAAGIKSGKINIAIGTHALIQKGINFQSLALVAVDEQHRFGVRQRAILAQINRRQQESALIPHFLSMSATPIPRTLMLTVFGDLDISTITELPAGRKEIKTKIVMPMERKNTYDFIRGEVKTGRQAFVICPRIEKAEENGSEKDAFKLELKSVKEEFEKLSRNIFPDLKIAMLHGQMKPKEKEKVMRDFGEKKYDILVSTSVIEVGVDIPNATIMMIEGADRFGLAQLYQFRGRVGRGEHQSYCFLFTDSTSHETALRLRAILEAKNGFELAEKDLSIRGPGEFLGTEQTGLPDIAMENLQNMELVRASRNAAITLLNTDPALGKYPELKTKLQKFKERIHLE